VSDGHGREIIDALVRDIWPSCLLYNVACLGFNASNKTTKSFCSRCVCWLRTSPCLQTGFCSSQIVTFVISWNQQMSSVHVMVLGQGLLENRRLGWDHPQLLRGLSHINENTIVPLV